MSVVGQLTPVVGTVEVQSQSESVESTEEATAWCAHMDYLSSAHRFQANPSINNSYDYETALFYSIVSKWNHWFSGKNPAFQKG